MPESKLTYRYTGAGSLVKLHEIHLRSFLSSWRDAYKRQIILPQTDDPDYVSLTSLLRHVFRSARGYILWISKNLELPDPIINPLPGQSEIVDQSEHYLEHLIEKWSTPLTNVPEEKFSDRVYQSNWGVDYCIDAMLEHAVMHPVRHEFQLKNIMANTKID